MSGIEPSRRGQLLLSNDPLNYATNESKLG
jgi:hypothetical protein